MYGSSVQPKNIYMVEKLTFSSENLDVEFEACAAVRSINWEGDPGFYRESYSSWSHWDENKSNPCLGPTKISRKSTQINLIIKLTIFILKKYLLSI